MLLGGSGVAVGLVALSRASGVLEKGLLNEHGAQVIYKCATRCVERCCVSHCGGGYLSLVSLIGIWLELWFMSAQSGFSWHNLND